LELTPVLKWYDLMYDARAETLSEAVKRNKAYAGVKGQKELRTRYVLEDLPMSLVPEASLGRMLGVSVERMDAIIRLGELLLNEDFTASGRTLENLGLAEMSAEQLIKFAETGER
jgi:opine dehydrogenase